MGSKFPPLLNKSHNFGIYFGKKGKRGILQLDFPNQVVLLIQRGHIKKTHPFHSLLYFDSEEDLHIMLRFLESDMDFDADTMEEKYTICRLLDLILEAESEDSRELVPGGVAVLPRVPIIPHNVIKDGVLEKKGNTTITTWNRRRVKICVGEFSYFKPGEGLALNVVQLWQDRCRVQRVGQNTIQLTVNQRAYCFRVPNDSKGGLSVETVRDEWINAFEQAMTTKRNTTFWAQSGPPPGLEYLADSGSMSDISSVGSSPFVGRKHPDQKQEGHENSEIRNQEITASVSVSFSYNQQTSTTEHTIDTSTLQVPGKPAKKTTINPFRRRNAKGTGSFGGSDVVSRPHPDSVSDEVQVKAVKARFAPNSVPTKSRDAGNSPVSSSNASSLSQESRSVTETFASRQAVFTEKAVFSEKEHLRQETVSTSDSEDVTFPVVMRTKSGEKTLQKMRRASSTSDLATVAGENNSIRKPSGEGTGQPPPALSLAPAAPAPPPPMKNKGSFFKGGVKLKQVYWTPVAHKQVSTSLWAEAKQSLPALDLKVLEEMFSITEKDAFKSMKAKAVKQTMLDDKRAQNLGIIFTGFKSDSISLLLEALSSVAELDTFQLQKMTTLKKYQPTEEDVELFGMYSKSRDTLAPVDRFMLDMCEIPKLSMRIDLALTLWDFPNRYQALSEDVDILLNACGTLLGNTSLQVVMRCLLTIGNHLNASRQPKEGVPGFQISSIDKMVDLKGRDPQYSLMTYLVEQLNVSRPDLLDWTSSLTLVPKVAGYSVLAIGAEIDVLKNDLQKVKKYQKALKGLSGHHGVNKKFQSDVQNFILEYEKRLETIQDKSGKLQHKFRQLLAWLGEPASRTSDVLFSSLALLIDRFQQARARLAT
ncbi:hypothetical protein BaRGS_00016536 [Batillaria attramentaria]|uniref:FH2 domain-containing protein n=1 Tax=Batillaria attramentaria TaxID=370345 RepID=A0ABD0KYE7_9CAEN